MRKPLIFLLSIASVPLVGCSFGDSKDNAPTESFLESIPIVYRQDIQQGNIITQEMINKLQPGMSKSQVRFVLGTPMLADAFHSSRWDYVYTMTEGWGETEKKRLTLFFEGDRLARLEGDYRPQPADQIEEVKKDTVVSIPDFVDPDRGILSKAVDAVSATWSDDAPKPKSAGGQGLSTKQEADAAELEKSMDSRAMP